MHAKPKPKVLNKFKKRRYYASGTKRVGGFARWIETHPQCETPEFKGHGSTRKRGYGYGYGYSRSIQVNSRAEGDDRD